MINCRVGYLSSLNASVGELSDTVQPLAAMPHPSQLNLPISTSATSGSQAASLSQRGHTLSLGMTSTVATTGTNAQPAKKAATEPFFIGEGLPVVPAKLVDRILRGDFLELSELLNDNIQLAKRNTHSDPEGVQQLILGRQQSSGKQRRREFTPDSAGLLSWVQCFGIYATIVCQQNPSRMKDLMAYLITMINEARRFKYKGWIQYDDLFRQQAAKDPKMSWSSLSSTLYAVTFLSQHQGDSVTCHKCLGSDHPTWSCALFEYQRDGRSVFRDWRGAERKRRRSRSMSPQNRSRHFTICFAWNNGRCSRDPCRFRHICVKCEGDHKASKCTALLQKASKE